MTIERWDDERLDRLASTVEGLASRVESLTSKIESHDRMIESNARVIQALAELAVEAREERQQLFQSMDRQQAEIAGLRTETNRLLDLLFNQYNQRNGGDNPTT